MSQDKGMSTEAVRATVRSLELHGPSLKGGSKPVMKKGIGGGKSAAKGSTSTMHK